MMNYRLVVLSQQLLLVATDNAISRARAVGNSRRQGGVAARTPGVRRRATRMSA